MEGFFTLSIKCWCIDQVSSSQVKVHWLKPLSECHWSIRALVDPTIRLGEVKAGKHKASMSFMLGSSQENEVRWEELKSPWRVLTWCKSNGQSQRGEI